MARCVGRAWRADLVHFSARVVWITTFSGYGCRVQVEWTIRDVCYQAITHLKQYHDNVVVAAQRQGAADKMKIT
jgi:hypothetical protein